MNYFIFSIYGHFIYYNFYCFHLRFELNQSKRLLLFHHYSNNNNNQNHFLPILKFNFSSNLYILIPYFFMNFLIKK